MKDILVFTPEDAQSGFALTGIRQQVVEEREVRTALETACRDPEVGVIAVDARLLQALEEEEVQALVKCWEGVLITLPAPVDNGAPGEDDLQRLMRRVLGYHVRLTG